VKLWVVVDNVGVKFTLRIQRYYISAMKVYVD